MKSRDQQLEQFVDCFQAIGRSMKRNQRSNHKATEMTKTQWIILRFLWKHGSCSIGQLAEQLEVRSSSMSQMIDRLELAGMVSREPNQQDARTKVVTLTDTGKDSIMKMKDAQIELLAGPFNQLTSEEQEILVNILKKMTYNLNHKENK
ncbi:MarR family winged helix-turn-helix transcriptional regulator [Metabacillus halosaccharovorans]|uniref:MarR family transcriptional regulator n=2 Tax=Metabacillus halosaccharovorans TaxID=930124 RepID=A0ABT3DLA2_9BACI|nr:MarR family transcriptional regulator [Metabacillus halosaccharovorans]MBU7595306.1 MarR family transcriptional regulator [Metabacillus halosaccharovorans]MCM3439894.1 MarR family transcriptional regulator [Metabacillus halosaccharovorans]MCV9887827.1 MarR family transcriptional regulator [Metabacillus halosaccharovorans]